MNRATIESAGSTAVADFRAWRAGLVGDSRFTCTPIDFAESAEWALVDGILRHRTRGFFSLAGLAVTARTPELDGQEQLIILQPETAINGFLLRRTEHGGEILFQGRVEPGNVDVLQLAPTVQSTEANYKRMHGGRPTAFLGWFLPDTPAQSVYDELQSEEATRYYGKYNRNVVMDVSGHADPELPPAFRWFDVRAIAAFAVTSNVLNTDARSVLSGLDWSLLAGAPGPFAGHAAGSFGAALRASWRAERGADAQEDAALLAWLTRLRVRSSPRHRVMPLAALANWIVDDGEIRERDAERGFRARQFRVRAEGREVSGWDQPLIDSRGAGRLTLVGQERGGVLRFLVKASHEIGFLEGVQLGASITVVPGESPSPSDPVEVELVERIDRGDGCALLHRCRQSEEGGRFYRDENDYEIALLDPDIELAAGELYRWLTLAQVRRLIRVPGVFSMEFRGVFALLLHYL